MLGDTKLKVGDRVRYLFEGTVTKVTSDGVWAEVLQDDRDEWHESFYVDTLELLSQEETI